MRIRIGLGVGVVALLLGAGCAPRAKINSAHIVDPGTHFVTSPGALSIVRQSSNATKVCTLRSVPGPKGDNDRRGGPGHGVRPGRGGGPGRGGPGPGPGGGPGPGAAHGPGAVLDVLFFRLCEARANNDISAEQYAASVQMIMKTMAEMATRPPPPGPGMGGPVMGGPGMGRPGMFGPGMRRRDGGRRGWGQWGPPADDGDASDAPPEKEPPKGKAKPPGK